MFWLRKNKLIKEVPNGLVVLIVGEGSCIDTIKKSKFLFKLYTTSSQSYDEVINIKFNTFQELANKCKALQVDLVIVEEEKWILEGIADVLRHNFVNCIGVTSKWTDLKLSNSYARELLEKYNVTLPPITRLPVDFPLILKGNGILKKVHSAEEVIKIREEISNQSPVIAQSIYLEKYLEGENFIINSLFDGKTLLSFPIENIDKNLVNEYTKRIENLLLGEKADFIGFINSKVIFSNNKLYNTGFCFGFQNPDCSLDILYVLWLAVYQKLNEITL